MWTSTRPTHCQICEGTLGKVFVDGKIRTMGNVWGIMCWTCFKYHGSKLGTGFGQLYDTKTGQKIERRK